jgi:hypothetical protein
MSPTSYQTAPPRVEVGGNVVGAAHEVKHRCDLAIWRSTRLHPHGPAAALA